MKSPVDYAQWMMNTSQKIPTLNPTLHLWTLILATSLGKLAKFTC